MYNVYKIGDTINIKFNPSKYGLSREDRELNLKYKVMMIKSFYIDFDYNIDAISEKSSESEREKLLMEYIDKIDADIKR
jgi:hypothetical protein